MASASDPWSRATSAERCSSSACRAETLSLNRSSASGPVRPLSTAGSPSSERRLGSASAGGGATSGGQARASLSAGGGTTSGGHAPASRNDGGGAPSGGQ